MKSALHYDAVRLRCASTSDEAEPGDELFVARLAFSKVANTATRH